MAPPRKTVICARSTTLPPHFQCYSHRLTESKDIGSSVISHLGRLQLCGVLYVAYEGSICICGQYMVCALYKSYFLLATPNRQCTRFTVEVIVRMALAEVLDSTSGKGNENKRNGI